MFTFATRVTSPGRSFLAARKTVSRIRASSSVDGDGGGSLVGDGEGGLVFVFVGEGLGTWPPWWSGLGDFFWRGETLTTGDERRAEVVVCGSSLLSTTRVPTISNAARTMAAATT